MFDVVGLTAGLITLNEDGISTPVASDTFAVSDVRPSAYAKGKFRCFSKQERSKKKLPPSLRPLWP